MEQLYYSYVEGKGKIFVYLDLKLDNLLTHASEEEINSAINGLWSILNLNVGVLQLYQIPFKINLEDKLKEHQKLIESERRREIPNDIIVESINEEINLVHSLQNSNIEEKRYILKLDFTNKQEADSFFNGIFQKLESEHLYYLHTNNLILTTINEDLMEILNSLTKPLCIDFEDLLEKEPGILKNSQENKYYKFFEIISFDPIQNVRFLNSIFNENKALFSMKIEQKSLFEAKRMANKSYSEITERITNPTKATEVIDAYAKKEEIEKVIYDITNNNQKIVTIQNTFYIEGSSVEEVKERSTRLMEEYSSFKISEVVYGEYDILNNMLGFSKEEKLYNPTKIALPIFELSKFYPFDFKMKLEKNSFFVNKTLNSLIAINFWQVQKSQMRNNFNTMIFGNSGSGKSTLLKEMIRLNLSLQNYIITFEMDNENKALCETFNGTHFMVGAADSRINLLQVTEEPSEVIPNMLSTALGENLERILRILFDDISVEELAIIQTLTKIAYFHKGINNENYFELENDNFPIFSDITNIASKIIESSNEEIHFILFNGKKISQLGEDIKINEEILTVFPELKNLTLNKDILDSTFTKLNTIITSKSEFNCHTTLDLKKTRWINFSLVNVKNDERSLNLYLALLIQIVNKHIYYNRQTDIPKDNSVEEFEKFIINTQKDFNRFNLDIEVFEKIINKKISASEMISQLYDYILHNKPKIPVFIDEAHRFWSSENCTYFLEKAAREFRKYGAGIYQATQSPRDVVDGNKQVKAMYSISTYIFILATTKSDLIEYANYDSRINNNIIHNWEHAREEGSGFLIAGNEVLSYENKVDKKWLQIYGGGV